MAHQPATQPTQQWTRRAGRAITYGPFARLGDWWCAGRDARSVAPGALVPAADGPDKPARGSPAPGPDGASGPTSWDTPRTVFLGQLGRGRAEKEWLRYQKEVAGYLIPLAAARADRDFARLRLQAARADLGGLTPPKEAELSARHAGEQRTHKDVVAARRMRAFTERQRAAEASVQQLGVRVAEHQATVARLSEPIRVRFEVAKTRAELIDAYVRRRRAYYLTRLVRKLAGAGWIGSLVRSDWPERPSWASRAISPDLTDSPVTDDRAGPAQTEG